MSLVTGVLVALAMIPSMLMQLLGAVFSLEFMALTRGTNEGESRQHQEKAFHGRAM